MDWYLDNTYLDTLGERIFFQLFASSELKLINTQAIFILWQTQLKITMGGTQLLPQSPDASGNWSSVSKTMFFMFRLHAKCKE